MKNKVKTKLLFIQGKTSKFSGRHFYARKFCTLKSFSVQSSQISLKIEQNLMSQHFIQNQISGIQKRGNHIYANEESCPSITKGPKNIHHLIKNESGNLKDKVNEDENRKNEMGIQMLSKRLLNQLYQSSDHDLQEIAKTSDIYTKNSLKKIAGSTGSPLNSNNHAKNEARIVDLATKHLKDHALFGKNSKDMDPVSFSLPPLLSYTQDKGSIQEHFEILGANQSNIFLNHANALVSCESKPTRPTHYLPYPGWTRYDKEGKAERITCLPAGEPIVFDVEVLYKISPYPVIAVACSPTSWYVWISPKLARSVQSIMENTRTDVINGNPAQFDHNTKEFSNENENDELVELGHADIPRLVVGHFVAYDRARIKEEYDVKASQIGFLDTLSLHCAVAGLSTQQRLMWQKYKKDEKLLLNEEENLKSEESLSQLQQDALAFYNQYKESSESDESDFATRWEEVGSINRLESVAELHLQGYIMDKNTRKEFDGTDINQLAQKFQEIVDYCATDVEVTFKLFQVLFPKYRKKCPHPVSFAGMMHMGKSFLTTGENWVEYIKKSEKKCMEYRNEIESILQELSQSALQLMDEEKSYLNDPWLSNLDWSVKPVRMTKEIVSAKGVVLKPARPYASANPELVGKPQWYRDLWDTKLKRIRLSTAKKVVPYLLKMEWSGFPIVFKPSFGWMFCGPTAQINQLPIQESQSIPPQDFMIPGYSYYRVPHPSGEGKNVGNPLSKSFSVAFDKGILTAVYPKAKHLLTLNSYCIYWISARARIMSQFVVWKKEEQGKKMGIIIPLTATMGTITRRATDATWMTASNAKQYRIGSELKAQITAPAGYKLVGADVDSEELWIASLIGDSQFGIHGSTAIGFMTLQGTKSLGTDLHSTSGRIVGISRDTAKIFNYSRIYGAGQKYAAQLLVQHNPGMGKIQAQDKAAALYQQTKGSKFRDDQKTFGIESFWYGGSESFMFNTLEKIANDPDSRTPVLGCQIPDTLLPKYVQDMFKTSRINWVVQSSGVDYLHLLLVCMDYLMKRMEIDGRFLLSIHDEVRFLIKEEHVAKAALALQISNLWTRCMFASRLGMNDLPLNVAFFSAIDIDHVMRKEVDMDCVTPSNSSPIRPGESQTIYQVLNSLKDSSGELPLDIYGQELESINETISDLQACNYKSTLSTTTINSSKNELFIEAQMCKSHSALKTLLAQAKRTPFGKRKTAGTVKRYY